MKSKLALFAFMGMALSVSGCDFGTGDGAFVPAGSKAARSGNEVLLFSVTTDAKPGKRYQAILEVDGSLKARKLIYRDNDGDLVYDLGGLNSSNGLVLLQQDGYKVVRLKSSNFRPDEGGAVRMVYLKSGISGSEGTFHMDIVREGQNWVVYANDSAGRRRFRNMFLKKNTFFGKTIGIASVRVSN